MALSALGWVRGLPVMSHRALLYRRPSEPQAIEVIFDRSIYLVRCARHRQARRYTLRIPAATREVILTIPPRGTVKEAREFAQKHGGWIAARLRPPAGSGDVCSRDAVPLRGVPHRITHRRGVRGTVWTETDAERPTAALRRRRCSARRPPHRRFPAARSQARPRNREPALCRRARRQVRRVSVRDQASRWGSCSTAGVLSIRGGSFSRPLRARLSRGARSRASGRDESFRQVLAPGSAAISGSRTRQGVARRTRQRLHRYGLPPRSSAGAPGDRQMVGWVRLLGLRMLERLCRYRRPTRTAAGQTKASSPRRAALPQARHEAQFR